jgi:hypothetical protein
LVDVDNLSIRLDNEGVEEDLVCVLTGGRKRLNEAIEL